MPYVGRQGVYEFYRSALLLKDKYPDIRFVLVGGVDPDNPASLSEQELNEWAQRGVVEWWGHQNNMAATLREATVVVLPSYREGMPKVLLEAQARKTCSYYGCSWLSRSY